MYVGFKPTGAQKQFIINCAQTGKGELVEMALVVAGEIAQEAQSLSIHYGRGRTYEIKQQHPNSSLGMEYMSATAAIAATFPLIRVSIFLRTTINKT